MTTLQVLDTDFSADSVEWCPHEGDQDILLCGTYQLDQSEESEDNTSTSATQTRLGKLHLYQLERDSDGQKLDHLQTKEMPGILDIKWCPTLHESQSVFGLVNSIGQLQIYQKTDSKQMEFVTSTDLGVQVLGLSLDWSNRVQPSLEPKISCSSSDGHVSICKFHQGELTQISNWKAHDFEAWITAFNYCNTDIVYTGGDDCKLKGWDSRLNTLSPIFTCKRHTMGVCSIQCHPFKENIIATGSYDENLIIWDNRNMRSPLAETQLGGGIWRIKWDPFNAEYILTASMYNGFHVVDVSDFTDGKLSVVCHYSKQESIGYGADICYLPSSVSKGKKNRTIATCSFYNHLLHLWDFDPNYQSNKEVQT